MKKITDITDITSSENFEEAAVALYGGSIGQLKRYADLFDAHKQNFPKNAAGKFFSSPGRIEVIGNHTDHNRGKVLAAAVTVDTLAFVAATDDNKVEIISDGYGKIECPLDDLDATTAQQGTSIALVKGVAKWFVQNDYSVGGFKATVISNVPVGSGVSSSASFEVLVAEIFNNLYNGDKLTGIKKAMASQFAENVYFGKPCGLMDQSAIAIGGVSMIDFKNIDNPDVVNVAWPFNQADIVITNTGGNHSYLTDAYSAIRYEMEDVAKYFGADTLRGVEYAKFVEALPELQNKVSGRAILRAMHFFDENLRVERAIAAITYSNLDGFLKTVNDSGDSSYKLLQNCYVPSDTAERIPLALAIAKRAEGVLASRVHGGGFAGTMLAFVEKGSTAAFMEDMELVFGEGNVYKLAIRREGACCVDFD